MSQPSQSHEPQVSQTIEIAIKLGIITLILVWCFQILSSFISVVVWGAILAVAIYPAFLKLRKKLKGNNKLASIIIALLGTALILLPVISLSGSLIDGAGTVAHTMKEGTVSIPLPSDKVQEWPIIGEKVYALWTQASTDLSTLIQNNQSQLTDIAKSLLGLATGAGLGALQFIVSILIASAFLAHADSSILVSKKLATRLNNERGEQLVSLSTMTIRSVAGGLLGIAALQALMAGIGMSMVDVPAAGLFALGVLIICIAQIPPILILGPVAFYVFSVESSTVATIFLIWCLIVNFTDMVLKPMLLGRGVDAPMLIILLGAIGGMLMSGIVGLFIGAVVLALGYKLFQAWLEQDATAEPNETST